MSGAEPLVRMRRSGSEPVSGFGTLYQYRVAVNGAEVGTLIRAFTRVGGYERLDGWWLVLDEDPDGIGQTHYSSLPDARERVPQQVRLSGG